MLIETARVPLFHTYTVVCGRSWQRGAVIPIAPKSFIKSQPPRKRTAVCPYSKVNFFTCLQNQYNSTYPKHTRWFAVGLGRRVLQSHQHEILYKESSSFKKDACVSVLEENYLDKTLAEVVENQDISLGLFLSLAFEIKNICKTWSPSRTLTFIMYVLKLAASATPKKTNYSIHFRQCLLS